MAEFVDFMVSSDPSVQYRFRYGLTWLDARARRDHGLPFGRLDEAKQIGLLEPLAYKDRQRPGDEEGRAFFKLIREYTVMGFYTSKDRPGAARLPGAPDLRRVPRLPAPGRPRAPASPGAEGLRAGHGRHHLRRHRHRHRGGRRHGHQDALRGGPPRVRPELRAPPRSRQGLPQPPPALRPAVPRLRRPARSATSTTTSRTSTADGLWEHGITYTTAPGTTWEWPRCHAVGGKTNFWGRSAARMGDIDFKAASAGRRRRRGLARELRGDRALLQPRGADDRGGEHRPGPAQQPGRRVPASHEAALPRPHPEERAATRRAFPTCPTAWPSSPWPTRAIRRATTAATAPRAARRGRSSRPPSSCCPPRSARASSSCGRTRWRRASSPTGAGGPRASSTWTARRSEEVEVRGARGGARRLLRGVGAHPPELEVEAGRRTASRTRAVRPAAISATTSTARPASATFPSSWASLPSPTTCPRAR